MISRYEVMLDGVPLSSMHDELMILDVQHTPAQRQANVARKAKGHGGYVSGIYQQQTTVSVLFELHVYDIRERQRVCDEIATAAINCKILQTSDRPGKRLHVICDQPPAIESAQQWTSQIAMTFSAYSIPFWEETAPAVVTLTGTAKTDTLFVPGNAGETFVDVEVSAPSGISSLTISAGSNTIALTGLSVAAGGVIKVTHDENGILSIKNGNTSILSHRTAVSSDDLLVISGKRNNVSVSANNAVSCRFSARGVWL